MKKSELAVGYRTPLEAYFNPNNNFSLTVLNIKDSFIYRVEYHSHETTFNEYNLDLFLATKRLIRLKFHDGYRKSMIAKEPWNYSVDIFDNSLRLAKSDKTLRNIIIPEDQLNYLISLDFVSPKRNGYSTSELSGLFDKPWGTISSFIVDIIHMVTYITFILHEESKTSKIIIHN